MDFRHSWGFRRGFLFVYFSSLIAQVVLEQLTILLPRPLDFWDYSLSHPARSNLGLSISSVLTLLCTPLAFYLCGLTKAVTSITRFPAVTGYSSEFCLLLASASGCPTCLVTNINSSKYKKSMSKTGKKY